ncbi:MAG: hypothetical protein COA79_15550 [Planctomycetota bacterium]|nr:MAG: hypothetical protein COA79_15550 [Planctomycetota bacterium]
MSIVLNTSTKRPSSVLQTLLRTMIFSGDLVVGELLPSVRELSIEYKLAPKTVNRAMKSLESEGLISIEPRIGSRVLSTTNNSIKGRPVAFILDSNELTIDSPLHFALRSLLEKKLAEKSCPVLCIFSLKMSIDEIVEQLKMARVWGVILDTVNLDLLKRIKEIGIPAVMMDAWVEDAPFDVVLQDNYQGGYKAADYLIKKGFKNIAWLGPIKQSAISRERFGGASSALASNGSCLQPNMCYECHPYHATDTVKKLLTKKNRPDAIISMWHETSITVARVAKELNIKIGTDIHMIGWTTEDRYELFSNAFKPNEIPPTIIWQPEDMAVATISRLTEHSNNKDLPTQRILMGTKIKHPKN